MRLTENVKREKQLSACREYIGKKGVERRREGCICDVIGAFNPAEKIVLREPLI